MAGHSLNLERGGAVADRIQDGRAAEAAGRFAFTRHTRGEKSIMNDPSQLAVSEGFAKGAIPEAKEERSLLCASYL